LCTDDEKWYPWQLDVGSKFKVDCCFTIMSYDGFVYYVILIMIVEVIGSL